jgi:Ser/Thr protein kinase RdoA (MazF antagonist)
MGDIDARMPEHTISHEQGPDDILDLNEIMHRFGVDTWENLGPDEDAPGPNLSVLVEIEGRRYVLRERPEGMLEENLAHRYDFQHYLQQAGIPLPAFHLTPQGEAAVALGEDYFELQQWSGGERFSTSGPRSLDWVENAGTMLGRIHVASQAYTGHTHRWPSEVHIGGMVQSWLGLARARADEIQPQAVSVALNDWVEQWEAVLPAAMMSIGSNRNLPEFHIHGDYYPLNLRFNAFGVTTVLGLEASHWEKRIFEVAYALFSFGALSWQPDEALTHPLTKRGFEPERASRFLQAYGELCLPAPGEAALLTDALLLMAPIATINGPLEDLFYQQGLPPETLIDDVMERLHWAASLPAWLQRTRRALTEMW